MRVVAKILLVLFFLTFSLTNYVNAADLYLNQETCTSWDEIYSYSITENSDSESYIVIPVKVFDNGTAPDAPFIRTLSLSQIFDYLNDKKFLEDNINTIAFLFKTEVFPNAP